MANKEIRNAILDILKANIDRENYGILGKYRENPQSYKILVKANIKISGNSVLENGKEIYHIQRKYSTKKRDGMYKQLVPSLVPVNVEIAEQKRHKKYVLGIDLDGTAGKFKYVPIENLYEERYFLDLEPHENLCETLNSMASDKDSEIDFVVVSSYLTDSDYAFREKNEWCNIHLPAIDEEHRIFVPNGENKADYIARYIEEYYGDLPKENFSMLDDYTPNLVDVDRAGYHAIKFLNEINGTHGTWQGDAIRFDRTDLETQLKALIRHETTLRDERYSDTIQSRTEASQTLTEPIISLQNFVTDYHSGELFASYVAFADYGGDKEREVAGSVDYSVYNDVPSINMIEVAPEFQRRGIGTQLMQAIQRAYPNSEISFGYTTPDGTPFVNAITYTVQDEEFSPLLRRYADLEARLAENERTIQDIYSLMEQAESRELSVDEQKKIAEIDELGDEWESLNKTLSELKDVVKGKKETHTFVYLDDEEKERITQRYSHREEKESADMATIDELIAEQSKGHEDTVKTLNALGYDIGWNGDENEGFSHDGFIFVRSLGNPVQSRGFDGWEMIEEEIESAREAVKSYSLTELTAYSNGNFDNIGYGTFSDFATEIAIREHTIISLSDRIADFYEHSDEAVTDNWRDVLSDVADNGNRAFFSYASDIRDYITSYAGELSEMEIESAKGILVDIVVEMARREVEQEQEERSNEGMEEREEYLNGVAERLYKFIEEYDIYTLENVLNGDVGVIQNDLQNGEVGGYTDMLYEIREEWDGGEMSFEEMYGEDMATELDSLIHDLEVIEAEHNREQRDIEVDPTDSAVSMIENVFWLEASDLREELEARAYNRTVTENYMPTRETLAEYSDEVLRRGIEIKETQERVVEEIQEENTVEDNSHGENFRVFYSYEYEQAKAFAIENNYHMIWGSDNIGLNGDSYVVYGNADDLPQYLSDYARGEEARGADLPYSHNEIVQRLYEKEMIEGTAENERYTRVAFLSPNERAVSLSRPMSEQEVALHFKSEFENNWQDVEATHDVYTREKNILDIEQNKTNIKGMVGLLESDASYEWIRANTPWGYWGANLVNPNQPQNYIEIGITGIERENIAVVEANLYENGNQLMQSIQTQVSVADVRNMENLTNGFTWNLDPSFRESVVEMARGVSEEYSVDLTYSDISSHRELLSERGYDMSNIDYEHLRNSENNARKTIANYDCRVVDEWVDSLNNSYALGEAEGEEFYYALVNENRHGGFDEKTEIEYDHLPTREEVESDFINIVSQRAIDRHEAEVDARIDNDYIRPLNYYEPQYDFDGTADELFTQARNGYIENPDALHRLSEILSMENREQDAEAVRFMEDRERESKDLAYSVAQMKLDMLNGHGGIDDVSIGEGLNLTVMYEPSNDTVVWQVTQIAEEDNESVLSEGGNRVTFNEFKAMSQEDFERAVNETLYYGMSEVERTPIEREIAQEHTPIEEIVFDGYHVAGENAGREAVYYAVLAYEKANNVQRPVIDENGSYEDKVFLYSAYDEYVAKSHSEELAPYESRLNNPSGENLAQIYYGRANGLNEEQINLVIECANLRNYNTFAMGEVRKLLESGHSIEDVRPLIEKDGFMLSALRGSMDDKTAEQLEILKTAENQDGVYNADYLFTLARREGDPSKYNQQAKALIEVLNAMEKHDKDLTSDRNSPTYGQTPLFGSISRDIVGQQIISAVSDTNIAMQAEEIQSMGRRMINTHSTPSTYEVLTQNILSAREKAMEENSHGERNTANSNDVGIGTMPNHEAEDKRRALLSEIKDGVQGIMVEDKFKAYLDTRSHLFYKNFSVNNAMSIFMRKPSATYVMGYEQWQKVGRTPLPKTGIPILVPMFYYEKYSGGLYKSIVANLTAQLERNPNQTAVYRVGKTGMELTMINNTNQMGIRMNGKEVGYLDTPKKQREFIDSNILNKMVSGFNINYVFDVSDTVIKDKIWVNASEAKKSELVLDKNGEPIKGKGVYKGKVQIYNTPERQAGFQPSLDLSVVEKDPEKMRILFDAIKSISEAHGVPVSVVERESDETLRDGADGYFKRTQGEEAEKFPKGYIVMPKDIYDTEPTKAVANLIHEVAHSDLHGNMEKLQERMGEDKITRDMKEVQAEATAYLTAKQYGLDTSTASFSYLAVWSKGFDLQTFEKSLDVINAEATKLVSEISAELELRGLTHDLQDKPKEPLSEEQLKAIAGNYVQRALEAQNTIDTQLATIPNLIKENANNADLLDIINQQNKNLTLQRSEAEAQINLAEQLTQSTDRAEQEALIEQLNSSVKRSENLRLNFTEKVEAFSKVAQRDKVGLKEQFIANPLKTINAMAKDYKSLADLSSVQKNYIAKSAFIAENLTHLLNSDPQRFVDEAVKRASDIEKIMAKNGSFVEVSFCESWENGTVFNGGELMHPKVADKIVKEAERQIEQLKINAEKQGEYVPYMKCYLTVYTVTEKAKNLTAHPCRIDLGDGGQKGLADYLHQTANNKTEMVQHFDKALNEKNAKDKIVSPQRDEQTESAENSHGEKAEAERGEGNSIEDWQNDINAERGAHPQQNNENEQREEKDKGGKNGKNDVTR